MSKIKYKDFKISKANFKQLKEISEHYAVKQNNDGLNMQLDAVLSAESIEIEFPTKNYESRKKERQAEDKEQMAIMREVALKEGIVLPDERMFGSSDELRVFLMMKTMLSNTALEKMCTAILPISEKFPLDKILEVIETKTVYCGEKSIN